MLARPVGRALPQGQARRYRRSPESELPLLWMALTFTWRGTDSQIRQEGWLHPELW